MSLTRIERTSTNLSEEAYARLLAAVLDGTLVAGDRLVQDKLAGQLDISRTPVRDALLRLEREGVIRAAGRRGYVVTPLGEDDVAHIYQAREAVEGYAARLVAERGRGAVRHVASTIGAVEPAAGGSSAREYHANRRVHRSVVEATGNPFLVEMFDRIWERGVGVRAWAEYYVAHGSGDVVAEHADLLDALGSGSGDRAADAMLRHVREGRGRKVHAGLAGA